MIGPPPSRDRLVLDDVDVRFGNRVGLRAVTLRVGVGERMALLGPSGVGKSSILRAIAGLIPIAAGRVVVDGEDVTRRPPERRGTVYLHQVPSLFPHLSVAENVAFPLTVRGRPAVEGRARALQLLARVGLDDKASRRPNALSGGERHRVALARALAATPAVLLLDEPFASLDPSLRAEVRESVQGLLDEGGPAVVMVTHDVDEGASFAHRIAVVLDGRIAQCATPSDLLRAPASIAVARFLGMPNIVPGAIDGNGRFVSVVGCRRAEGAPGAATLVARPDGLVAHDVAAGDGESEARVAAVEERIGGAVLRVAVRGMTVIAQRARDCVAMPGDAVRLTLVEERTCVLRDAEDVPPDDASTTARHV